MSAVHDTDETESQEERHLRTLLERAVPTLPAPPDRLRQVHRRVVTRRRRRTAVGTAVTGAAAVVALLYSPLGALSGPPALPGPQAASPSGGDHLIDLSDGTLILDLPSGWYAWSPADQRNRDTVFVANRPLKVESPCPSATTGVFDCAPLSGLAEGEVLISLREAQLTDAEDLGTDLGTGLYSSPDESCRSLGGDPELAMLGRTRMGGGTSFPAYAHVCLKDASAATRAEATAILNTAVYDHRGDDIIDTPAPDPEATTSARDSN